MNLEALSYKGSPSEPKDRKGRKKKSNKTPYKEPKIERWD